MGAVSTGWGRGGVQGACPPLSCDWWGQPELSHPFPAHLQCEDSLFSSSGWEARCGIPAVLEEGPDFAVSGDRSPLGAAAAAALVPPGKSRKRMFSGASHQPQPCPVVCLLSVSCAPAFASSNRLEPWARCTSRGGGPRLEIEEKHLHLSIAEWPGVGFHIPAIHFSACFLGFIRKQSKECGHRCQL